MNMILLLAMCPALAVATTAFYGMGMGVSTMAVLVVSNLLITFMRKVIPDKVRIPACLIIVASLVTVVQLLVQAYLPDVYEALGIYIPLIAVNCMILGQAESFPSGSQPLFSVFDGFIRGLKFTLVLTCIGFLRELVPIFALDPGAFLVSALLIAFYNWRKKVASSQFPGLKLFPDTSGQVKTAAGMGCVVAVILMLTSATSSLIYDYVLIKTGLEYLQTMVFILLFAAFAQILGMLLNVQKEYISAILGFGGLAASVMNGFGAVVGFAIAVVLMAGVRERITHNEIPRPFQGLPLMLLTVCLMAIAFYGFTGLI